MSDSNDSDPTEPAPERAGDAQGRLRLLAGVCAGALLGALLAWYAGEVKAEEERDGGSSAPLKAGDLITLGVEVLGFVKIVYRTLRRI